MLKKAVLAVVALSMFMVTPAFPQGTAGCRSGMLFIGTYTSLSTITDIWGDGTNVLNQTIAQITLHSDGTASWEDTSARLLMLSFGTFSQQTGSWKCRSDGKVVVTWIWANYFPTTDAINHPSTVPNPPPVDLVVGNHIRQTFLFSLTDANTLTLTQRRSRVYDPTQDPTNPTGGVLFPLHTGVLAVYKRLVASDADLLAP